MEMPIWAMILACIGLVVMATGMILDNIASRKYEKKRKEFIEKLELGEVKPEEWITQKYEILVGNGMVTSLVGAFLTLPFGIIQLVTAFI